MHQQDQSLQAVVAAPKDFYNFEKNELLMNKRVSSGAFPPQKPPANHGWAMREYERVSKAKSHSISYLFSIYRD